ncbi:c-type cytochrome [Derxia lacustris]|uniref:c-type cytochrome n=1 Tax=Derxia lacustris TaxID=764842 RepID=UPI000A17304E|nr:cytochrome c [Derxia lacustris]
MRRQGWRRGLAALGTGIALLAGAPAAFAGGAESFANVCAACHGAGGVGIEGLAPPLRNPAHWQALGERAPDYLANVLAAGLSGTIEANGQVYRGLVMPAQTQLAAAEAAEIASWVLGTLNGLTQTVTPEAIEAARKSPLTHARLRALRKGE